jgi:hypothetical protein
LIGATITYQRHYTTASGFGDGNFAKSAIGSDMNIAAGLKIGQFNRKRKFG